MRKLTTAGIALLLLLVMGAGCGGENSNRTQDYLQRAPSLNVSFTTDGSSEQSIQALQLTTSWTNVGSDGNIIGGYEADSPHPLQISDYSDATLKLGGADGEMVLHFGENYPPQSISVQRWDASLANGTQDITEVLDKGKPVDVSENRIIISDDGISYIYEVHAIWTEGSSTGSSYYAFRTESISAD